MASVGGMTGLLREPLSDDQLRLLHVIFDPFSQSGEWPVWQYVDLMLDAERIDAADVLGSLPRAGEHSPVTRSYGLTWRENSHIAPAGLAGHAYCGGPAVPAAGNEAAHDVEHPRRLGASRRGGHGEGAPAACAPAAVPAVTRALA
jgi:hypothetical protein